MKQRYIYIPIESFWTGYQPDGQPPISSTNKALQKEGSSSTKYPPPRRLTTDEIPKVVNDFRMAAKNAIEAGN